jgi:CubicO group peptidase (beta-lactamase class C family)
MKFDRPRVPDDGPQVGNQSAFADFVCFDRGLLIRWQRPKSLSNSRGDPVVLIARKDKVAYFRAFGYRDREQKIPMTTDSIFRIASMTKLIVSFGAMMLAEEGKLDIAAPVSQYLPEFKDLKVSVEQVDAGGIFSLRLAKQCCSADALTRTAGAVRGTPMQLFKQVFIAFVAMVVSVAAHAEQQKPVSRPETLGFAADRLERVTKAFQSYVDSGQIPGDGKEGDSAGNTGAADDSSGPAAPHRGFRLPAAHRKWSRA